MGRISSKKNIIKCHHLIHRIGSLDVGENVVGKQWGWKGRACAEEN